MDKLHLVPLEEDIHISLFQHVSSLHELPIRVDRCIICMCMGGSADIEINSVKHTVIKNEILIFFPNQILLLNNQCVDFTYAYFSTSRRLLNDILFRFPPEFIGYLRENFHHALSQEGFDSIYNDYFRIIEKKFRDTHNICRREIIINLIRNFFLETYNKKINFIQAEKRQIKRKHELVESFINLLMENYTQSREVAFYAEKLCITPKYLSMVLKEQNGKTAKEWIDVHVIAEIKLLLKSTNLSIQEIAYKINFPNQSFLCKYFKAHTGLSPTHYRTI